VAGSLFRIDAKASREFQAILFAIKSTDRDVRAAIRKHTKAISTKEWQQAMREQASTRLESRVLAATARVAVSDQNIRLSAATVGRPLSGGLKPSDDYAGVEFGAGPRRTSYQSTSRRGNRYTATRNTRAQLRPRNRKGYVFFPAVVRMVPRIASLWAQTVVRTLMEKWGLERG
jgi:hypothetical protein